MHKTSDLERLSSLIDVIYQGATEPGFWSDIVAAISAWLGSTKGMPYTPLNGRRGFGSAVPERTPGEVRVAVAATAIGSPSERAGALSLGISTVKIHLEHAYSKTGVKGRTELVRVMLGLASHAH